MSIEITLYPKAASRDELSRVLRNLGFTPVEHLWDWPKGSLHFSWFDRTDYRSFDGVEATIYPPSEDQQKKLGRSAWALHTRTRASASPADKEQQNTVIRIVRQKFGGNFYNDCYGTNRYIKTEEDPRLPVARGIYLVYETVTQNIKSVRHVLPKPLEGFERLTGTKLESLRRFDPTRVLYNALVPFAVAAIERFFSQCFKIMLQYDPKAHNRLRQQTKKIDLVDALAVQRGEKTLEDLVTDWYSFQNIHSIHAAFFDWFGIDVWKILKRRRKIGRSLPILERHLDYLIQFRHGIVHRLTVDLDFGKHQIEEMLDLTLAIFDTFVDHLEKDRNMSIRD
jgi:hypothetical protein